MEEGKLYTRKQFAQILGVDPLTIRRYEKEGKVIPVMHVKNRPRYSLASLESVAKSSTTQPA